MHAEVPRAELSRVLTAVSRVVEHRNTYPILANVLLLAEATRLTVRGSDLDIDISIGIDVACTPGCTTVSAKALADIVRKLGSETVILDLEDDDTLVVKGGRSRFRLPTLAADSFPELKADGFAHSFRIDLAATIAPVAFAVSTEETRYYLNGVYLHPQGGKVRAVATDGHRMARNEVALDALPLFAGIIIPAKTVKLIRDYPGIVDLDVGPERLRFRIGDAVVVSKLVQGTFPDYERVTPKGNDVVATLDRKDLLDALGRVSIIASDRGGKAVKMSFAAGGLRLHVSNPDHGSATDDLAAGFDGEPFEIGFNARYTQDVLQSVGGDTVTFAFKEAGSPATVSSGGSCLCVLMPMRV